MLAGEWQRSEAQQAAVLAAPLAAAALIGAFGPWYHRLHRLTAGRRADAAGTNLVVAGLLVTLGGLSFTYFGLIVCWFCAGAALSMAAACLDAAAFSTIAPELRRKVAARCVVTAGSVPASCRW